MVKPGHGTGHFTSHNLLICSCTLFTRSQAQPSCMPTTSHAADACRRWHRTQAPAGVAALPRCQGLGKWRQGLRRGVQAIQRLQSCLPPFCLRRLLSHRVLHIRKQMSCKRHQHIRQRAVAACQFQDCCCRLADNDAVCQPNGCKGLSLEPCQACLTSFCRALLGKMCGPQQGSTAAPAEPRTCCSKIKHSVYEAVPAGACGYELSSPRSYESPIKSYEVPCSLTLRMPLVCCWFLCSSSTSSWATTKPCLAPVQEAAAAAVPHVC